MPAQWLVVSLCKETKLHKHNTRTHNITVFTKFGSLPGDGNDIVFKSLHVETHFPKFVFSGHQNAVVV